MIRSRSRRQFLAQAGLATIVGSQGGLFSPTPASAPAGSPPSPNGKARRGAKISRIELHPVEAPNRTLVPLTIETDDGRVGVGECGLQRRVEAIRGALEHIRPVLLGQDADRIEHLWQTVFRGGFYPADRVIGSVLAGIDMALWDLKGKACDRPVYDLLGGLCRDRVFVYSHNPTAMKPRETSGSGVQGSTSETMPGVDDLFDIPATVAASRDFLGKGFRFLRFSPPSDGDLFEPRPAILSLLELIDALRSHLGNEFEFIIDLHTRLSPADAIWFCREVEQYRPYFVEDPLRPEYIDGYAHVRRQTAVPLAIGEQYMNKWDFRSVIENDLVDFARIDLAIACGLTEGRKIAGWCEVHHVQLAPHNPLGPVNLAAGLHLNLATAVGAIQETPWLPNEQLPDVFQVAFGFENGALTVPISPGLGVRFNPEAARAHSYTPSEPPHYHRLDGGYTNY